MLLSGFQTDLKLNIYEQWKYHRNVCGVMPTGAGKTVTLASIIHEHVGHSCVIAHRQELVGQISMALAREGVRHNIIGPTSVIKEIVSQHIEELGANFYDVNARTAVAGVDTLIRRKDKLQQFFNKVTLFVIDEGHHVLKENKWGTACLLFPNAKGLMVTATPCRADGKGLGRHSDGLMDIIVEGPSMRWLIENYYLTDYRVFCPQTQDLILDKVDISKTTGDYNPAQLKKAIQASHLVGDVIDHYIRIAHGKRGVTFCTDVEAAGQMAEEYRARGLRARMVHGGSSDRDRIDAVRLLKRGELDQLTNCDLFGEGFDLPAIEVVSMARPTQSYSLYTQQFGRALRLMIDPGLRAGWDGLSLEKRRYYLEQSGKTHAIIIDHGNNVIRHGLPDRDREWTLDARSKIPRMKNPDDDIPLRFCYNCTQPYPRINKICPYCGAVHTPGEKSKPEHVDGDLLELSPATLEMMRKAIASVDESPESVANRMKFAGAPEIAWRSTMKNIKALQQHQQVLRDSITWWAAWQKDYEHLDDSQIYRKFYLQYGVDILTAQTLGSSDATQLNDKLTMAIQRYRG